MPAPEAVLLHAGLGCVSASIGGGDCGNAAITGALNKLAAPSIGNYAGTETFGDKATGVAIASVAGGTISELTGGKFANGAVSGAYGYMYNYLHIIAINVVRAVGGFVVKHAGRLFKSGADDAVDLAKTPYSKLKTNCQTTEPSTRRA